MQKTSLALNNLRGYAIIIVVAFHSCIAYIANQPTANAAFNAPPFDWLAHPIVDSDRFVGFDLFCALQFLYMMQLMFFLSGLFVWSSLRRKGPGQFLWDRFLRLGLPFLIGVYLLMPFAYYPVYRVTAADPSWSQYFAHFYALPFTPTGPLWFLSFAFALNIFCAALYWLAPRTGEVLTRLSTKAADHPLGFCLVLAAATGLAYIPVASVTTPWQWITFGPIAFQSGFASQYAIYFFAGMVIGAVPLDRGVLRSDGPLAQRWGRWVVGALAAFVLWIVPTALSVQGPGTTLPALPIAADFGVVLYAAAACLALAAIFLRFAAVRRPIFEGVAENAYGIYLFHYFFVMWLQYALLHVSVPGVVKGAVVFGGTLVLSWGLSVAVCRTWIGNRLIGGRRVEASGRRRAESKQPAE
ncbi:MAG: acyltransferase [Hyphomicrobiales bacterium]|nr:acyltransferase [Hyphomicrobiales bacterium]MBV8827338.1 acyltransferase [Hyphomicrobiales bacterium]